MTKASQEEIKLHNLILEQNDLAFVMLCDKYLEVVITALRGFNPRIHYMDNTLITEVVIDSFYSYLGTPQKFNSEKQSLEKFLILDAQGDLINAWAKRERLKSKLTTIDSGNAMPLETDTPEMQLINQEAAAILKEQLEQLFDNEMDVEIANLILSKERDTAVYADLLKIDHLEFGAQQQEVKRHKDRIKKVLTRKLKDKQY